MNMVSDTNAAPRQQPEEEVGRAESGFVGLENQGSTCYLNALLQVSGRFVRPMNLISRMNGKKKKTHTHTHMVLEKLNKLY